MHNTGLGETRLSWYLTCRIANLWLAFLAECPFLAAATLSSVYAHFSLPLARLWLLPVLHVLQLTQYCINSCLSPDHFLLLLDNSFSSLHALYALKMCGIKLLQKDRFLIFVFTNYINF